MTISLGLDIGSNSVGRAWIDTEKGTIECGVSIFPSGVEEKDEERGEPVGRARRSKWMLRPGLPSKGRQCVSSSQKFQHALAVQPIVV